MFKNKSEFQVLIDIISITLLVAILGLLFLCMVHFLFLIPLAMAILLYFGMNIVAKNHDFITLKIQNMTSNISIFKILETHSVLGVLSFMLLAFNMIYFVLLFFYVSFFHPWLQILTCLLLGVSLYFGTVFGLAGLFNKEKKRFFAIMSFIGHLGLLGVVAFLVLRVFLEFLALMFFGPIVYDDTQYSSIISIN